MKRLKTIGIIILAALISYLLALAAGGQRGQLVHEIAFGLLPVLGGLLIAAVGVFLGSLGNLFGLIEQRAEIDVELREAIVVKVGAAVHEVRENVLYTLAFMACSIALQFIRPFDVLGVAWPFTVPLLGKLLVFDAVTLTLAALSFIAIWDSARVMFTLHRHYEELVLERLRRRG